MAKKKMLCERAEYYNKRDFVRSVRKMRQAGGAKQKAAEKILAIVQSVEFGIQELGKLTNHGESRIKHCIKYDLPGACRLVTVESKNVIWFLFAGDHEEVDRWIKGHEGHTFAIGSSDKKVTSTKEDVTKGTEVLSTTSTVITDENKPLFQRFHFPEFEEFIPQKLIRKGLLSINEETDESDITETIEMVHDEQVRNLLLDLLVSVREGAYQAARARVDLYIGKAVDAVEDEELVEAALSAEINSETLVDFESLDKREIDRLFDPSKFEDWMLFLHPEQKKVVFADFDCPCVLKGVSGSGKTVVLIHRARHLSKLYPDEKIGILTLNRSLSVLLRNLVAKLCLEGEGENLYVQSYYDYFQEILQNFGAEEYLKGYIRDLPENHPMMVTLSRALNHHENLANDFSPHSGETIEDTWREFWYDEIPKDIKPNRIKDILIDLVGDKDQAERYIRDEFTLIRSAFSRSERQLRTGEGYRDYQRTGRCIPFTEKTRSQVLSLLLRYEEYMFSGGMQDELGLGQMMFPLMKQLTDLPEHLARRCLLIDEFQDFSTIELRLLKQIPSNPENGLFMTGDLAQKVMVKDFSLGAALLDRNYTRSQVIRKNYRNSRQILEAASALVRHYEDRAKEAAAEFEFLNPEYATRETSYPVAMQTNLPIESAWKYAYNWISEGGYDPWSVCLVSANTDEYPIQSIISKRHDKLEAEMLSGDYIETKNKVSVCSLNDVKGFEFSLVIIVGCDSTTIPSRKLPEDEQWRDALRLYVAMTRGRDQVVLTHKNGESVFLSKMSDFLVRESEELEKTKPRVPKQTKRASDRNKVPPEKVLSYKEIAKKTDRLNLSHGADILLRNYFERRVYRPRERADGGIAQVKFLNAYNLWRNPRNIADLKVKDLLKGHEGRNDLVTEIDREIRRFGYKLVWT